MKRLIRPEWIADENRTSLIITTHWGNEFHVVGLDEPARIEGDEDGWDLGVVDETADLRKPGTVEEHILPTMATRHGVLAQIGVPDFRGKNSIEYKKAWDDCVKWDAANPLNDDGGKALRAALRQAKAEGRRLDSAGFSWESSAIIKPEQLAFYAARMSGKVYAQEWRASWETAPGRAYYEYDESKHVKPTPYVKGIPIHVSCDFNFAWHNWIMAQVNYLPHLEGLPYFRIYEQVYLNDANVRGMITELARKIRLHDPSFIIRQSGTGESVVYETVVGMLNFYGDYSGEQKHAEATYHAWQQIKRAFPKARFLYVPQGPISTRVDSTNAALWSANQVSRIQIDARVTELQLDLSYVTRAMLEKKATAEARTHASDCLGYLIVQIRKAANLSSQAIDTVRRRFV